MEGVSEAEGYLKIAVLAACVIKGLFPLLQGEDVGDHAVGFQVSLPDVLNHKGVGIGAQVGAQNIQLLPVADNGKVQGALISFDPNLRPPLWPSLEDAARQIREGLALCDILKIADNEIEFITGEKDFDRAAGILQREYPNIRILNVTAGADGSYSYSCGHRVYVPGFCLGGTIETTGAGDTFCACVLDYVLTHGAEGLTPEQLTEMLRFANAAAYLVTTRKGAIRSMPEKEQVLRILEG